MARRARSNLVAAVTAIAVWLGVGVAISIVLAWVPPCVPTSIGPVARPIGIFEMPWPHEVPSGHGRADGTLYRAWAFEMTVLGEHGVSGGDALGMMDVRAGWPMRCVVGWDTDQRPFYSAGSRHGLLEFRPPWMDTVRQPVMPLWLGLAVNAAIFGTVARTAWWGVGRLLRKGRRERGECESCGYSREGLGGAAACPECGAGE